MIGGVGGGNVIGWGRSDGWPILHTISTDYPGRSSAQRKWKELIYIYSAHDTQRPSAHCQKYICIDVFQKQRSKIFVYKLWNNLNFKERRY